MLVNHLVDEGLVATRSNPAHRRSSLVALTPAGERTIARVRRREARLFGRIAPGTSRTAIERATRTLRAVRAALEVEP